MDFHEDLDKCAYYSPTPLLLLSRDGLVLDFNLAARVLWGTKLVASRAVTLTAFFDNLHGQLKERPRSSFLPSSDALTKESAGSDLVIDGVASYSSRRFGRVDLLCTMVPLLDPDAANGGGFAVYFEIIRLERLDTFRELFVTERQRQVVWEEYAVSYDRVLPLMPYYQEVVRRHVATFSSAGDPHIIEVGAGTGNVVVPLLQAGLRVTAVDTSRAMLDRLRAKVQGPLRERLTILEQDAEYLPQLPDDSCDGASILLALFDMTDPMRAFAETLRVLRPGAILVITEPKEQFQMAPILDFVQRHLRAEGQYDTLLRDVEHVFRANWAINPSTRTSGSPLRVEVLIKMLASRRYRVISCEDSHFGNCATITAVKH